MKDKKAADSTRESAATLTLVPACVTAADRVGNYPGNQGPDETAHEKDGYCRSYPECRRPVKFQRHEHEDNPEKKPSKGWYVG